MTGLAIGAALFLVLVAGSIFAGLLLGGGLAHFTLKSIPRRIWMPFAVMVLSLGIFLFGFAEALPDLTKDAAVLKWQDAMKAGSFVTLLAGVSLVATIMKRTTRDD